MAGAWSALETFAKTLQARWIVHRWRKLFGKWVSMAAMSPGAPSLISSSGA
jgi:hypothetical protein